MWRTWLSLLLLQSIQTGKGSVGRTSRMVSSSAQYHRVCYFTSWGAQRTMKEARLVPEDVPADLCTHIFYAFANIAGLGLQAQNPNDLNVFQGEKVALGSRKDSGTVIGRRSSRCILD